MNKLPTNMMSLPLKKKLEYISPSTFMVDCELSIWISKCSDSNLPHSPQTRPMSVGSAFDAFVKARLAELLGKRRHRTLLSTMLRNVEHHDTVAIGNKLCQEYERQGCMKRLLEEGLHDIELEGIKMQYKGVTIFGYLDGDFKDQTPVDWKVTGFESKYNPSPKKGHLHIIEDGMITHGENNNYLLEEVDNRWAIQTLFYNWMLGKEIPPYKAGIEQILINKKRLRFVSYRNEISVFFATKVFDRLADMWRRFTKEEVIIHRPEATQALCEPFNNPRPCTLVCPFYRKRFGQETEFNKVMNRR